MKARGRFKGVGRETWPKEAREVVKRKRQGVEVWTNPHRERRLTRRSLELPGLLETVDGLVRAEEAVGSTGLPVGFCKGG